MKAALEFGRIRPEPPVGTGRDIQDRERERSGKEADKEDADGNTDVQTFSRLHFFACKFLQKIAAVTESASGAEDRPVE